MPPILIYSLLKNRGVSSAENVDRETYEQFFKHPFPLELIGVVPEFVVQRIRGVVEPPTQL